MNLKKTRIFSLIKAEIHVEINSFVPRYFSIVNCLAYIIAPCPKLRQYFNKHFMPWFFIYSLQKNLCCPSLCHSFSVLLPTFYAWGHKERASGKNQQLQSGEHLGLLFLVALPWDTGGGVVCILVLLHQHAQIS